MRSPADPADVEEQPSDGGLDAEDIKFLRSLRTSETPGPSSDGEAGERSIARRLSSRTVKKLEVASDEIELQPSVWDSALFQFASVSGRGASVFTLVLLVVNCVEINQCVGCTDNSSRRFFSRRRRGRPGSVERRGNGIATP